MNPNAPELVQCFVVNGDLPMTAGTIAVQVAHAATTLALQSLLNDAGEGRDRFHEWLQTGQKKIVLKGSEADVVRLAHTGWLAVRTAAEQAGVPAGSWTVAALAPMDKRDALDRAAGLEELG
ncbi:aminoacyl-tRNA hydrolase [Paenibacillus flagellatus]|uniref:peptidyl-tRNA hydrolase n=1 Tax=Paenibacillus flagellatus TaxID=2211139 RepID=A0A2V5KFB5_9BACL|nr:aminoacyl-tRNA hydrolase [Paenibacillus flagellatus]PYI57094.1 peptidyl-tRNA hydrolase [Paenibacillus flagellatus]